jgi:uncharacterized RDD family membrane protein YckC
VATRRHAVGGAVAATGRFIFRPVRAVARTTGIDTELEAAAVDALATPAAARTIDGMLAGPLPDAIAHSLIEHRVVERIVSEAIASGALERAVDSALHDRRTEELVERVLDSRLTGDLTDRILRSPEFERVLAHVLASPQVRAALAQQSTSLAADTVAGARTRALRLDGSAERRPRRWFRKAARLDVPYAGFGTRGIALAVDALLVTLIFLIGAGLVGLVASLVGHLRPAWLVGVIEASAWLVLVALYFAGFWTAAGQTPGMRLMRVRVLDQKGSPPGFGRSLLRLFGLGLAIIPCFLGFLPALVDDRRRALQDFLARTVVVYDEHVTPARPQA